MKTWVKFLLVGGLSCLLFYIFFAELNGNFWSPAWVQAIGSIAAILVAVYVPSRLEVQRQQREEKERLRVERVAQHTLILELSVIRSALLQYKILVKEDVDLLGLNANLLPESYFGQMSGGGDRLDVFMCLEETVMSKYTTLIAMVMHVEVQRKILLTINELGELGEDNIDYMVSLCDEAIGACDEMIKVKPKDEFESQEV
ncbi:hypothetical protein [Chromohalobacter israelensis]|uniref:hypothetical protein n=1 Tax=Chromohalobacter israelensis TaxID=141390 RepID=UPI0012EC8514|nr:hypothetical protein [Chromohalobacter israelensis]MDF9433017.1 hypothetical protein [Chromohalobacter israelensis]